MLIHIDPATDAITVTEDPRCTSLLISQTTPAGDTYWFSDNYNTYARIIGGAERGVPDCSLRLLRDQTQFDRTGTSISPSARGVDPQTASSRARARPSG